MAIVPKRKTSKQRRNIRRAHDALTAHNLISCKNCSQLILQHRACKFCGFYKNKKVEGYQAINDK